MAKETGKLKPTFKKAWVKALRSGKYEQGVGELKGPQGKYCCLGVACQIDKKAKDWVGGGFPESRDRERWGLGSQDMYELSDLNDSGVSFVEIAGLIENGL